MRTPRSGIAPVLLLLAACLREDAAEREAPPIEFPDDVREELVQMGIADQEIRAGISAERMQDTLFAKEMLRSDSVRSLRLREIVIQYGWPDSAIAGKSAANAAFLILQHSPLHGFQQAMLPQLEELARSGKMPPRDVAMLADRVLMHAGKPQRYGTQFSLEDGRWVLHPVEDEAGLEERRRAMGFPPMTEYIRQLEELTGTPVARQDSESDSL